MDEKNDLIKVGKYDLRYDELLRIDIGPKVYQHIWLKENILIV